VVWDGVGFEMAHVGLLSVGIEWERDPQVTFGAGAELVTDFEGVGSMRNHFVATSFIGGYGFYTRVGPRGNRTDIDSRWDSSGKSAITARSWLAPSPSLVSDSHIWGRPHLVTPANTSEEP
jgi:hypothetical protein